MKIIFTSLCAAALSVVGASSAASAAPGDSNDESRVEVLSNGKGCAVHGGMCFSSGAEATVSQPSSPSAGLGTHQAAGAAPGFSRVTEGASRTDHAALDSVPWTVEVNANLRNKALAGNAVFLVYDAENTKALANREVVGAWQANIPAGDTVSARLILSPSDGFHAGHTYRVRVVQLVHGKEILLSDGPVRLL